MNWWRYVERISAGDDQKAIAAKAGIDQSTVSRWKSSKSPGKAENVAAFARAYERPVVEAFVAAGFITGEEAGERPAAAPSLDDLTDDELLAEVRRRMAARSVPRIRTARRASERPDPQLSENRAAYRGKPDTLHVSGSQDQIEAGSQDPGDMEPR